MALLAVIAAFNEERMIGEAVRSALAAGVDEVHVFDGAWRAGLDGPAFAGARTASSSDDTGKVAREAGAVWHPRLNFWLHQGEKRTAMFHGCGAGPGDHLFVLDADEVVSGKFEDVPLGHFNVKLMSVGENDLPGIRKEFPRGDYRKDPAPCFRGFAWSADLTCICPGYYAVGSEIIKPYLGNASRLPLVDTVLIHHLANERDPERLEAKRAFYEVDHPVRQDRVGAVTGRRFVKDPSGVRRLVVTNKEE